MTPPSWMSAFREPAARWRPMPLWVWNNAMSEARIDAMLDDFQRVGFGGVYVHPRPGMITEYLSPAWFRLWRYAADGCRARGMHCEIYDEHSYPSGFAGGHTVAAEPGVTVQFVRCRRQTAPDQPAALVIACSDEQGGARAADAWTQASAQNPVMVYTQEHQPPNRWTAHRARPDLSRREATRAFLACTHEAYARELGDHIGRTTCFAFTDEPTLHRGSDSLLYSSAFARAFHNDHGYELAPLLPALFCEREDSPAVRRDYYFTANRLFCHNYFRTMAERCEELGLAFTGHVDEHQWPAPMGLPSICAALRWMHAPGNDLLGFQFVSDDPALPSLRVARVNLHQLDSIARQCDRPHRLVESGGGGGYDFDPNRMKPLEDWLLSFGVNQINPHLSYASCAGTRKWDFPQTISDHAPWFADYRDQADHVGRIIAALEQGRVRANRLLLIDPGTSGWVHYSPGRANPGLNAEITAGLQAIRDSFFTLVETLDGNQLGYDLGDECVLAELGAAEGASLRVGACVYDAVILPACMSTIEASTCALLEAFIASGGQVYAEGTLPGRVDGRPSTRAQHLSVVHHEGPLALCAALRSTFPPAIAAPDGSALPSGLCWRLVDCAEGQLLFLANPWSDPIDCHIALPGESLLELDSSDGSSRCIATGGGLVHRCQLAPGTHQLLLAHSAACPCDAAPPQATTALPLTLQAINTDHPNLLPLDYAEAQVGDEALPPEIIAGLDARFWQAQGFDFSLWSWSIQYQRNFLDLDMSETRPFCVRYHCHLDDDCPRSDLSLAIERPWLYCIRLNGTELTGEGTAWFDEDMRRFACGKLLQAGDNLLELSAERLHPLHELAPVWLLGDMALRSTAAGFAATAAQTLRLGDIGPQGLPCYLGTIDYRFTFHCDSCTIIQLDQLDWAGTCLRIAIDQQPVGRIWQRQTQASFPIALQAGDHELCISCVGNNANASGPHHTDGLPHRTTWTTAPVQQPPGSAYRRQAHGLLAAPRLRCC